MSKKIFVALLVIFSFLSFVAFKNAMPTPKNQEVMKLLKPYIPYKLEKRLGGLSIVNTQTNKTEKPSIEMVYKRLDQLEQKWGREHLKIKNDKLSILKNGKVVKSFRLKNRKEIEFVHKFFGI